MSNIVYEDIIKLRDEFRKSGDKHRVVACAVLIAEIQRAVTPIIQNGTKIYSDAEVISTIKKLMRNWMENPADEIYIEIGSRFIPQQLTLDDLISIRDNLGATNIGEFMKYLKSEYNGLYDGKLAKEVWDRA